MSIFLWPIVQVQITVESTDFGTWLFRKRPQVKIIVLLRLGKFACPKIQSNFRCKIEITTQEHTLFVDLDLFPTTFA